MSSLLGFIQLLLVLVPVGKKQHKAVITDQQKTSISTQVLIEGSERTTSHHILFSLPIGSATSPATSQDDKGIPAAPLSILDILLSDCTSTSQSFSNKPFRSCALYILYCQLKSDC